LRAPKQFGPLRLEQDIIDFFKSHGKGHIAWMQAVLEVAAGAPCRARLVPPPVAALRELVGL
jgi:hypothetical protein